MGPRVQVADRRQSRAQRRSRSRPKTAHIEGTYARQLRSIAKHVGEMIAGFEVGNIEVLPSMTRLLGHYADALTPWATAVTQRMHSDVDRQDLAAWHHLGRSLSTQLRHDILRTPVGASLRELLHDEVDLIRSLPIQAGERVHELTIQALEDSTRAKEIAKEIMRSGEVTQSRATLIARTEVARTATTLLQVRAVEGAGALTYIWHTAEDADVRPGHAAMDGKVCAWANPPAVTESGGRVYHIHPGTIWNCRCWAEPIITE